MSSFLRRMGELLQELKRRHVFKVAGTYAVVALLVVQVTSHLFPALLFPEWTQRLVVILAVLGFPVALVLAWAFEMTPEGVRPTERREPEEAEGDAAGSPAVSRAVAVGITAGLLTVLGFGLWTAGWDPTGTREATTTPEDSIRRVAVDSPAPATDSAAPAKESAAPAKESAAPVANGRDPAAADEAPADPVATTSARDGEPPGEPAAASRAETGGAAEEEASTPAPTSGVVVLVSGEDRPGHAAAEDVLLRELAADGFRVADRTSLELQARAGAGEGMEPGRLGRRAAAAVVVMAEYRAQASQQIRGFYTGTATLSVRAYSTATGELLFSESFSVGGDTPGEMASTPAAAAAAAAETVAYRAASAVGRALGDRIRGGT